MATVNSSIATSSPHTYPRNDIGGGCELREIGAQSLNFITPINKMASFGVLSILSELHLLSCVCVFGYLRHGIRMFLFVQFG